MCARFVIVIISVSLLWGLTESAGSNSNAELEMDGDKEFHECCLNLRLANPLTNCQACVGITDPQYCALHYRIISIRAPCPRTHRGCYHII